MLHGSKACSFCFNDTATTEIYTLSLHDALPIYAHCQALDAQDPLAPLRRQFALPEGVDRKSTRLNSSHITNSYAVFCLQKKMPTQSTQTKNINNNKKIRHKHHTKIK